MLRGIFLMSRPPLLGEGGDFARLQLNPSKTKPPFVNTSRMPSRRGFWRDAAVHFGQDCLSREIYSHAKIFLTNVQTPVPRLKPGAWGNVAADAARNTLLTKKRYGLITNLLKIWIVL